MVSHRFRCVIVELMIRSSRDFTLTFGSAHPECVQPPKVKGPMTSGSRPPWITHYPRTLQGSIYKHTTYVFCSLTNFSSDSSRIIKKPCKAWSTLFAAIIAGHRQLTTSSPPPRTHITICVSYHSHSYLRDLLNLNGWRVRIKPLRKLYTSLP